MPERKRIAIYTSSFPPKSGGIAAAHYNLFCHLSQRHDVKAFVISDPSEKDTDAVIRGRPFPGQKYIFRFTLRRLLKQFGGAELPQIDSIANAAASVTRMNRRLAGFQPHLIICPDFDVPALLLKKPPGAKLAWVARHNYLRFTQLPLLPPENWNDLILAHRLERRALKKADLVISPSEYMIRVFDETLSFDIPKYVAKNFVAKDRVDQIVSSSIRDEMKLSSDTILIYIPDGGTTVKGARYTFEIARRLSRKHSIAVYVPGHITTCLRHELENTDGLQVHAPGRVPYEKNLANVAACDFGISPTLAENLSNALVESIMLGVPIVTFDTGGNREIIIDGQTGFVVPYADVEALIETAEKLVLSGSSLRELKNGCAENANRIVNSDEIIDVYEQALNEAVSV